MTKSLNKSSVSAKKSSEGVKNLFNSGNPLRNFDGYRTAESVSPKHPDKICDQISDAVLDAVFEIDPKARVAVDVAGGHGEVFVAGEITTKAKIVSKCECGKCGCGGECGEDCKCKECECNKKGVVNVPAIIHRVTGKNEKTFVNIVKQSPEIAQGVDTGGAGDQGIMIGYATDETPEMLPLEVVLSRRLNQFIYDKYPYDGKTQVTLYKDKIDSIVASFQNVPSLELASEVKKFLVEYYDGSKIFVSVNDGENEEIGEGERLEGVIKLHINPAGDWSLGGFDADSGLTGRKLAVDNYGPAIPVGGGAFSGKDPSKVDRSAAYMARKIAVDYLKARKAHEVYVRLAYAIGYAEPLEKTVIIDGVSEEISTYHISERKRRKGVLEYDLTPRGIIEELHLLRPIYECTARYGHFGEKFDWDL